MGSQPARDNNIIGVQAEFDEDALYERIVNPHLKFRCTYYFIDHWLPLLGPPPAAMILAVQQACWQGGRRQETGQITQEELGRFCGRTRQRVNQLLGQIKKGQKTKPKGFGLISWFVTKIDNQYVRPDGEEAGKGRQVANVYRVRVTDPLTPSHTAGLEVILRELGRSMDATGAIQSLLNEERSTLLDRLNKAGQERPLPGQPHSVRAIVADVFGEETAKTLLPLTRQLRDYIVQPEKLAYIGNQYFRREWGQAIGPHLFWFVTVIRRHCFEHTDEETGETIEIRDEFKYTKIILTALLGVSPHFWERHFDKDLVAPFFPELKLSHHLVEGRVLVKKDPLLDENSPEFDTGTPQNLTPEEGRNSPDFDTGTPQNLTPEEGQNFPEFDTKTPQNLTPKNNNSPIFDTETSQNLTHESALNSTLNSAQQKHSTGDESTVSTVNKKIEPILTKEEILTLLNRLEIGPPTREELAKLPWAARPGYLAAWVEWYEEQDIYGPGWIVLQIRAELLPPSNGGAKNADPLVATITRLYEQERFGRITSTVTDLILEATDPERDNLRDEALWKQAFRSAVSNNVRTWSYVRQTAENLHQEQAQSAPNGKASQPVLGPAAAEDWQPRPPPEELPPDEQKWQAALGQLQMQMTRATFDTWIKPTRLIALQDGVLILGAANASAKDWLENRLSKTIRRTVSSVWGRELQLRFQLIAEGPGCQGAGLADQRR